MLKILLGTNWITNRNAVMQRLGEDIAQKKGNRILIVPELISHDTERLLCQVGGDVASRYAEVLSFSRLADRVADASGNRCGECMDNGGRIVAMASAVRQLHSRIKAYAAVETKPEFLSALVDAVDEFKCCCITPGDLQKASEASQGSFAQKLEEIALIYEAYDSICARGKMDPRDRMTWLLEQLEDDDFVSRHVFYIDGFPDFTRQHLAVLEHIICNAPEVVVSLNCDCIGSNAIAFEKAGATAEELLRIAKKAGVAVEEIYLPAEVTPLTQVQQRLFEGDTPDLMLGSRLTAFRTETLRQECVAVAEKILKLVQSGCRYRDIGVVCSDMAAYKNTLHMILSRCKIPSYLSGTEEVLEKNAISAVLSAIEAALGGFEQQDVIRYLKSMLSPLSVDDSDLVDSYAYVWMLNGSAWCKEWTKHPGGLGKPWTQEDTQLLERLNAARITAIAPLETFKNNFLSAQNMAQQVEALYLFFEEISLAEKLGSLADAMEAKGESRTAQILNQLWEILLAAMEQMHSVLAQTVWDAETFTHLFKLLLSQYDVGTIPPVLDSVSIGSVSAMRCHPVKHLFVMGAKEGSLPACGSSDCILSDGERVALRKMGIPINDGSIVKLQAEFAEIYGAFCCAAQTISVSCPAGQPSYIYQRISKMAGKEEKAEYALGAALADKFEAGAYLSRWDSAQDADTVGVLSEYQAMDSSKNYTMGSVSYDNITRLYGNKLYLSATKIDRQAMCRLGYFLEYGLKIKRWETAEINPAEFGTYVHYVMENTVNRVMKLGGFRKVTADEISDIAMEYSRIYAAEKFSDLDSERVAYLFRRNMQELDKVVRELWEEMHISEFEPIACELRFADKGAMPAVDVGTDKLDACLTGSVDRVDVWENGQKTYYRVVDYKTGEKSMDYCDIFNGIGLQMFLYLFALEQQGGEILGENPTPAGVQYFPARVPYEKTDGRASTEEVEKLRKPKKKRNGLILNHTDVVYAMEPVEKPTRLCASYNKDGALTGDIASGGQLQTLKKYIFMQVGKMVNEIASGNVEANPYQREKNDACRYCHYDSICHPETLTQCRKFAKTESSRFWEDVEKVVAERG